MKVVLFMYSKNRRPRCLKKFDSEIYSTVLKKSLVLLLSMRSRSHSCIYEYWLLFCFRGNPSYFSSQQPWHGKELLIYA